MVASLEKKPEVDECMLSGPIMARTKDGIVKTKGNLYVYMEEVICKSGSTGGKESGDEIMKREKDIVTCGPP